MSANSTLNMALIVSIILVVEGVHCPLVADTQESSTNCRTWEQRRYLKDGRPFLEKFKEVADEIEIFPFQWLAYPGAWGAILQDNAFVTHQDAQWFFHFVDVAQSATQQDLKECVRSLSNAPPKQRVLLLTVLHLSLDDQYLPVIARYADDYSKPFPRISSEEDTAWRKERARQCLRDRISLVRELERNNTDGSDLNFFEQRVLRTRSRFAGSRGTWFSVSSGRYRCAWLPCVSDYALAILSLRGCGLAEPMRDMWRFHSQRRSPRLGTRMMGYEAFQEKMTVEKMFGEQAWESFRSLTFNARRLRHRYIFEVECVAPTYQKAALAEFVRQHEATPPRTAALACFCIAPSLASDDNQDELLIPDWPEYVRRIPQEQVVELLTGRNLDAIDADLVIEPEHAVNLGYGPYLRSFLEYVLRHRLEWFNESQFAEIEPTLNAVAREAWKAEARKTRVIPGEITSTPFRLPGTPDPSQLHDIEEADPAYVVKKDLLAWAERRSAGSRYSDTRIDYIKEVKAPASSRLFPDHRFFVCHWTEIPITPSPNSTFLSSAFCLDAAALGKDLKITTIGPFTRLDKNFGEFLADQKTKILDEDSARLVWDAFCEIRRWHSKSEAIEKVSDRQWHLGVKDRRTEGGGKAYHEVRLNEELTVESMEHVIEGANRWKGRQ